MPKGSSKMKNQILIKDGTHLITLTSNNFFIDYNEENQTLKIQQDSNKPLYFKVFSESIKNGKSAAAIQYELEKDIPVFIAI